MLRKQAILVMLAATLTLAGCKTAQERAQEHFASAKEFAAKGDLPHAVVEFRNVFQLDSKNRDARMAYARMLKGHGDLPAAYGQYNQITEWYPNDIEAVRDAARTAAELSNWPEAKRQVTAGLALAPTDPDLLAVQAAVDYSAGVSGQDNKSWQAAAKAATDMLATRPDDILLRRVVFDSLMRGEDYAGAEREADAAIARTPKDKSLYELKLSALAAQKDDAGIEAELKKMVDLFPDDPAMGSTLLRWYVAKGQLDAAEAFLRGMVASHSGAAAAQPELDLVGFLARYRSPDVALAELDRIIAAPPPVSADGSISVRTFQALRASILFDKGQHQQAMDDMKAALKDAPDGDETRRIKVALAKMEAATGDMVGARALVEQVLAEDKGQLDAVKLKAGWLIQGDNPDDAITLLRSALDAHPNDVEAITLMAQAYERLGNRQLLGDMLSQAVQASNAAPDQSIRYAAFLVQDKKYTAAESVLVASLRLDPTNVGLLAPLGQLYVLMKDWPRASQVADRLDELATPQARQASDALRPTILAGQQKTDEAVSFLQGLAAQGGSGARSADVAILRTYMSNGEIDKAQAFVRDMLAKTPDDPQARFLSATVDLAAGNTAAAEATFRGLVKEDPKRVTVWVSLIGVLANSGQDKAARAALDEALAAQPDSPDLLQIRASYLERDGDPDGAIKIYDQLYQQNSENVVLANNLASLLSTYHGTDPQSLDRAYAIARRLQGTTVPAFQDTYGWISFLRGDVQGALPYLVDAATKMPKEALAQYHLAEAYRALNRPEDAKTYYAKVVALVAPGDTRPFVEASRKMLTGTPAPDAPKGG